MMVGDFYDDEQHYIEDIVLCYRNFKSAQLYLVFSPYQPERFKPKVEWRTKKVYECKNFKINNSTNNCINFHNNNVDVLDSVISKRL